MKRLAWSFALAAVLALPVFSIASENERTLTVRGSAVVEAAPDTAVITLAVETMGQSAKNSAAENARLSDEVFKSVRASLGQGDKADTSSFSVSPVYDYDKGGRQILRGFRTVHQIKITASMPSSAGGILDAAMKSGANRVVDVRFDMNDMTKACEGLIRSAAARAAAQAEAASSAFGAKLGAVKSIMPSCAREAEGPVRFFAAEAAMKSGGTPIEPGSVRLRSDVEAVYFLLDEGGSR